MYDLGKTDNIDVTDYTFDVKSNYKRGDKGMSEIYSKI